MTPDQNGPKRPPEDLDAFSRKLGEAQKREENRRLWRSNSDRPPQSALGLAFRVAVELVSAVAVGAAIGYGLDWLIGTRPWLMVAFIVLGFAAGVLNVYRMARGFSGGVGYQGKHEAPSADPADKAPEQGEDRRG